MWERQGAEWGQGHIVTNVPAACPKCSWVVFVPAAWTIPTFPLLGRKQTLCLTQFPIYWFPRNELIINRITFCELIWYQFPWPWKSNWEWFRSVSLCFGLSTFHFLSLQALQLAPFASPGHSTTALVLQWCTLASTRKSGSSQSEAKTRLRVGHWPW